MRIVVLLLIALLIALTACTSEVIVTETNRVTQTVNQTETITITKTETLTITTFTDTVSLIEVISLIGPIEPINWGGPTIEITLKNMATEPIVYLSGTLELSSPFDLTFDIKSSNPLLPNESRSSTHTLIGGGFDDNTIYALTIDLIFQSGKNCVCAWYLQIEKPPIE